MAEIANPKQGATQTTFCALCAASGVTTLAERYKGTQLMYCTFHYWLIRGRVGPGGYSLEDYVKSSKLTFTISLPSKTDCDGMQKEYDDRQRRMEPIMGLKA